MISNHNSIYGTCINPEIQACHIAFAIQHFLRNRPALAAEPCGKRTCKTPAGHRRKLAALVNHAAYAVWKAAAGNTVHNYTSYCELSFVWLIASLAIDNCRQQLQITCT